MDIIFNPGVWLSLILGFGAFGFGVLVKRDTKKAEKKIAARRAEMGLHR